MIRIASLARPAIALSIALCAMSARADVTFGNIADMLRGVTGTATLAIAATGSGVPLSITRSVSFTDTGSAVVNEHFGAFGFEAGSKLDGTYATISAGDTGSSSFAAISASADATWTGMLINPFSTAQRFVIYGNLNYDSSLRGTSLSKLTIGDFDVAPIYGAELDIGVLAPGAGVKVTMSSHADGTFERDFDGAFFGWTGGNTALNGYRSTAVSPVPEPSTYAMFAAGLIAIVGLHRRRSRSQSA